MPRELINAIPNVCQIPISLRSYSSITSTAEMSTGASNVFCHSLASRTTIVRVPVRNDDTREKRRPASDAGGSPSKLWFLYAAIASDSPSSQSDSPFRNHRRPNGLSLFIVSLARRLTVHRLMPRSRPIAWNDSPDATRMAISYRSSEPAARTSLSRTPIIRSFRHVEFVSPRPCGTFWKLMIRVTSGPSKTL